MSQLMRTPDKEQVDALIKSQQSRFIKNKDYDPAIIQATDDGPVAFVEGEEIPIMDMAFDAQVVQPGHVTRNKELKDYKGKILVLLDPANPGEVAVDELTLMPVTIVSYGYRNYDQYDEKAADDANKLLCYSTDGIVPSSRIPAPLNTVCAELTLSNGEYHRKVVCPYAQWEDGKKPDCRAVVTLGFFDLERRIPLRISLHGTAYGSWNALQKAYRQARNVARLKKKSINDYVIKMTVEDNGTYYTPQFKLVESDGSFGRPADYLPICKFYMGTVFSRIPEDVQSVVGAEEKIEEATEEDRKELADAGDFTI